MEQWRKSNKMIRMIGMKEDPHEYAAMSMERLRALEALLSTHITWYTHKNPYGCSICDLLQLADTILESFKEFLGASPEVLKDASKESTSGYEGEDRVDHE